MLTVMMALDSYWHAVCQALPFRLVCSPSVDFFLVHNLSVLNWPTHVRSIIKRRTIIVFPGLFRFPHATYNSPSSCSDNGCYYNSHWHPSDHSPPQPINRGVSTMGLQFGSFNGICETAALVICPLIGTAQGVVPSCYSRNVDIGNTLIFQPCK